MISPRTVSAQWTIYDPAATTFMVDLMTPQRGGGYKPDMAFGAFLGYTIQLDTPVVPESLHNTSRQHFLDDAVFFVWRIIKREHVEIKAMSHQTSQTARHPREGCIAVC